ncbi:signal peptidase II [Cupriavidus necator]
MHSGAPCQVRPHAQRWWKIALAVLLSDISSKAAVTALMPYGQSIPLTGFFNLVHTWNTGAGFSFLANAGGWQRYLFVLFALGVSIWLVLELRKPLPALQALAYSLILGGALGNAVDRVMRGHVVDYLDFHLGGWHWPAFNAADVGIVCGAVLLVYVTLRQTEKPNE